MNSNLRAFTVLGAAAGLMILAAGCTGGAGQRSAAGHQGQHALHLRPRTGASPLSTPARVPVVATAQRTTAGRSPSYHGPHFASPQAAMRYLASAYNERDAAGLHAVTTPQAFKQLAAMHSEAVDLRLKSCQANPDQGDYSCYFVHDYPASLHKTGHGASTILVAPARDPGWYMYTLIECG